MSKDPKHYKKAGIAMFLVLLTAGGAAALIPALRPTESQLEKRPLAEFPKRATVGEILDGTWFSEVNTWYSDTFPLREEMLTMSSTMKELYGLQGTTVVGQIGSGDDIPEAGETISEETEAETQGAGEAPEGQETQPEETESGEKDPLTAEERDVVIETTGTIYIEGNRAYDMFYFNRGSADAYVSALNTLADNLDPKVEIYDLLAPTASDILLPRSFLETIGSGSEEKVFAYMFGAMRDRIIPVEVTQEIRRHVDEYIYFRTDHHWTSLGAYYAYCEFAKQKGWTPAELSDFESIDFTGFLGSYYSGSNQSSALAAAPDTITAYYPKSTNSIRILDYDQKNEFDWQIIHNVGNNSKYNAYVCFIGGDYPLAHINNPEIEDGEKCVIIKDSYANCLIPFLVDHYEDIYIVDFRYYTGNLYSLIYDNDVDEVIFINNAESAASSPEIMGQLKKLTSGK